MAGIAWITCPACEYRFYILEDEAGFGYEWFCPRCQHRFTEEQAADANRARETTDTIGTGASQGKPG